MGLLAYPLLLALSAGAAEYRPFHISPPPQRRRRQAGQDYSTVATPVGPPPSEGTGGDKSLEGTPEPETPPEPPKPPNLEDATFNAPTVVRGFIAQKSDADELFPLYERKKVYRLKLVDIYAKTTRKEGPKPGVYAIDGKFTYRGRPVHVRFIVDMSTDDWRVLSYKSFAPGR